MDFNTNNLSSSSVSKNMLLSQRSGTVSKRSSVGAENGSEIESQSQTSLTSSDSAPSNSTPYDSEDSFAKLTLDVVRKITYEEELRASQQLACLEHQEKTLVENAKLQMSCLESLKKKLREKGDSKNASLLKNQQKNLILRLRQERAQLRCLQEAYRGICNKHHSILADKRKLLNEPSLQTSQMLSKKLEKEKSYSSKTSESKVKDFLRQKCETSSTSTLLSQEELLEEVENVSEMILGSIKSEQSNSSQNSIIEKISPDQSKSSVLSYNKSTSSAHPSKQGTSQNSHSVQSSNFTESSLQNLKKPETSKRHLTKRDQRSLQRRKSVEKLHQRQMKLESKEMPVTDLEEKSAKSEDQDDLSMNNIVSSEIAPSRGSEVVSQSDYQPLAEGNITATSTGSVDEELQGKDESSSRTSTVLSASSLREMEHGQESEYAIKIAEKTGAHTEEDTLAGASSNIKSTDLRKSLTSDRYSESFVSSMSPKPSPPMEDHNVRSSAPSSGGKKDKSFTIKSPLTPARTSRRLDSSGSDDSYTISHSETASDQSDIEVRIHVLSAELRKRKYEAEKLKREHKRKYREQLKGTELSLQKQLEAYNNYIQQMQLELEQIEATLPQLQATDVSPVKPQIKWPRPERVIDSRRLRKQLQPISSDILKAETKSTEIPKASYESIEMELEKKGKLVMKNFISDPKKKPFEFDLHKGHVEKKTATICSASADTTEREKSHHLKSDITNTTSNDNKSSVINDIPSKTVHPAKENTSIEEGLLETSNSSIKMDSSSEKIKENMSDASSNSSVKTASFLERSKTSMSDASSNSSVKMASFLEKSKAVVSDGTTSGSNSSLSNAVSPQSSDMKDNGNQSATSVVEESFTSDNASEVVEENMQESDQSSNSADTFINETSHSSENESTVESRSNADSGSVKGDFESGSYEGESSAEASRLKESSETEDKNLSEFENPSSKESTTLKSQGEEIEEYVDSESKKSQSKDNSKSEKFVVSVVNCVYTTVLDDAIKTLLDICYRKKTSKSKFVKSYDSALEIVERSTHISELSEKAQRLIANDLLKQYLNEAIFSIINIAKTFKNYSSEESRALSIKPPSDKNQVAKVKTDATDIACQITTSQNELKFNDTTVSSDITTYKKHVERLEDAVLSAHWDNHQLEQQILQQYPYYYRKIPNKPPPPYTPPADVKSHCPLPLRIERPIERPDSVKHITKNIDGIVNDIADSFIEGKHKGLDVSDILPPNLRAIAVKLNLQAPCQLTFMTMVFDLAKEIALDQFSETQQEAQPWIKPRQLTSKPLFPRDKNRLISVLLKEIKIKLKIASEDPLVALQRKKLTWSEMKLGRKKRDFVDTILIREIKKEEPDWINYDDDEVTVKFRVADMIFGLLMDDTMDLIQDLDQKLSR